jgi:ELWxxDGT repeat protein
VVGNTLYFRAFTLTNGYELWKTDGTTTSLVADITPGESSSSPGFLTAVGNTLFFAATDPTSGRELWKTDGTTTSRVADIRPGVFQFSPGSSYPEDLTAVGNTLFFTANDGSSGRELWKTDGTTTSRVANIFPGEGNSNPRNLTVVGRAS